MLSLWRRHTPQCPQAKQVKKRSQHRDGRSVVNCDCPIWVDGELNGKRFRRSAGTKDWQRALRKIAAWENPEAASLKPVAEAIAAFKVHCRELSPSSRRKYRNVFRQLENFCKKRGIDTLAELTVEVLDEYRAQRDISPLTATKELQTLRQFCGFCLERGWLRKNLAKGIRPPKNANPRPIEPYTAEEVAAIIAACSEIGFHSYERLRARAMILLMRYAALRISDVVTLAKSRIKDGLVHLHTQKTGGTVLLPLPAELQQALDSLPLPNGAKPGCPYFFWNGLSLKRHLVTKAHRTLYAVFEKAEVENARSHRFRHTLATEILAKGGTEQDVADVLGISPAIVRKHYAKWTQARQERVIGIMKAVHGQVYQLPDKPAEGKETVQ